MTSSGKRPYPEITTKVAVWCHLWTACEWGQAESHEHTFFFAFSIQKLSAAKVISQLRYLLHYGARPESYSTFKTGLPLAKRGDTVFFR